MLLEAAGGLWSLWPSRSKKLRQRRGAGAQPPAACPAPGGLLFSCRPFRDYQENSCCRLMQASWTFSGHLLLGRSILVCDGFIEVHGHHYLWTNDQA